jgi:hypothetical protein
MIVDLLKERKDTPNYQGEKKNKNVSVHAHHWALGL